MATLKPRAAQALAAWAWAAVGLTPLGWFYGSMAIAYSHLGDVTDRNMMFGGVVLFAAIPTTAFILAIYAARAGHRSGKIAVMVSGLLLLATLVVLTLVYWWVGLPVTGVVAVLVLAWVLSRKIAAVVSGLLLLATLLVSAWLYGGWINVAVIAVTAVAAGLGFAWVRSRNKPPPGSGGARREVGPPAAGTPPGERIRPGAGRRDVHHLDPRGEHRAECLNERAAPRGALRACGITPTSSARTVCSGMPDASSAARCALIPAVSHRRLRFAASTRDQYLFTHHPVADHISAVSSRREPARDYLPGCGSSGLVAGGC